MPSKTTRKPQRSKPENISQHELESRAPDAEVADTPGNGESISKAEAIRRAIAAGVEGPAAGAQYIRKEFGIELTPRHFSATKAQQKNRGSKSAVPVKRGRPPKIEPEGGYLSPPPKPRSAGEADLLAAMEAIKPLVDKLGKEQAHRIVDLLG